MSILVASLTTLMSGMANGDEASVASNLATGASPQSGTWSIPSDESIDHAAFNSPSVSGALGDSGISVEGEVRPVAAIDLAVRELSPDLANTEAASFAGDDTSTEAVQDAESSDLISLQDRIAEFDRPAPAYRLTEGNQIDSRLGRRKKLFGVYESVLLQPTPSNSTGLIIETDSGYSHVMFPWKLRHSPRVSFGYDPGDDTLGWRVRLWEFRHNEMFAANAANGLLPPGFEGTVGYLSEDGDITTGLAFIEEGTFHSHIRTDVIDWELQRHLNPSINLYAGVRYAKVKQEYAAATDRGNLQSFSQFRGVGPTVALMFEHRMQLDRLILFSVARGSMLFGQRKFGVFDDVNNMVQSVGEIDLRSGDDGVNAMSANAELQLGIRYEVSQWLALQVALETQHFGEVGGANPPAVFAGPDSGLSVDSPLDDDLNLFGLSCGATLTY